MRATFILITAVATAVPLGAQSRAAVRVGLSQPALNVGALRRVVMPDSLRRSYWLEGTIIGGALGLLGGLQLQGGLCQETANCSSSDHIFFLIPTLVFAVVGGLIGSTIRKD